MAKIRLAIVVIDKRRPARVEFGKVISPLEVTHIHYSVPCEKHSVASVSGRHHTVEHIHSPRNAFENIRRSPDTHKVAWLVLWKKRMHDFKHLIHLLSRFTHRKSSYCIAFAVEFGSVLHCRTAQVRINAALDDWENRLGISVERLRLIEMFEVALQPVLGELEGFFCILVARIAGTAFIESHHNIRANNALCINIILRSKAVLGTVDMGTKSAAIRSEFTHLCERKDLKSAAVRKYRAVPMLEFVESARPAQYVQPRTKIEMVGVAENYFGLDVFHQVSVIYALDRADCPDRHEYRSLYLSVVSRDDSASCRRTRIRCCKFECHVPCNYLNASDTS